MPAFYIEIPTPTSRRRTDSGQATRKPLGHARFENNLFSGIKNVADVQNIESSSKKSNNGEKRKRKMSESAEANVQNVKKARSATQAKSEDKSNSRAAKLPGTAQMAPPPKWIPIPTTTSYNEIMDRMQLREFLARFQPLTSFSLVHLDPLSRLAAPVSQYLPRATLRAILLALLDLVGVDGSPDLRRACQATIKYVRAAKGDLEVVWDSLAEFRRTSHLKLPDPSSLPAGLEHEIGEQSEDEEELAGRMTRQASKRARVSQPSLPPKDNSLGFELIYGAQFLPILLFLAQAALQTPSVRSDIDAGLRTLTTAAHKSHVAKVAEEKERWAKHRRQFADSLSTLEETKAKEKAVQNGRASKGDSSTLTKIKELKAKRKVAEAKHRRKLRGLAVSYNAELRSCAGRGTFLGSDRLGYQFFALVSQPKTSRHEGRWDNWSTFVACWGKRAGAVESSWYGFDDPAELRNLAATLGAESSGPSNISSLVKSVLSFAEFLEDRAE